MRLSWILDEFFFFYFCTFGELIHRDETFNWNGKRNMVEGF